MRAMQHSERRRAHRDCMLEGALVECMQTRAKQWLRAARSHPSSLESQHHPRAARTRRQRFSNVMEVRLRSRRARGEYAHPIAISTCEIQNALVKIWKFVTIIESEGLGGPTGREVFWSVPKPTSARVETTRHECPREVAGRNVGTSSVFRVDPIVTCRPQFGRRSEGRPVTLLGGCRSGEEEGS